MMSEKPVQGITKSAVFDNTSRRVVMVVMVLVTLLFVTLPRASADNITVNSSSAVTFLDSGLCCNDFPAPFTAGDFTLARTGPAAYLLTSTPFYVTSLADGPAAKWIGTSSGAGAGGTPADTALYAISFNLPSSVTSGSLLLYYAVDNELGYTNPGVYINGTALPYPGAGTCGVLNPGCFQMENSYSDPSIGPLLVSGTNWLYFDAVNLGAEAGFIFSANINYVPSTPTPEASTLALLGTGLLGVGIMALRRKPIVPPGGRPLLP